MTDANGPSAPQGELPPEIDREKVAAAKKRTEDLIKKVEVAFGPEGAQDDVVVLLYGLAEHLSGPAGKKARADGMVTGNGIQTRCARHNTAILLQIIEETDKRTGGGGLLLPGRDFRP